MTEPIAELEVVVSRIDVEACAVGEQERQLFKAGTPGTVVLVHAVEDGESAYEVEFPLTGGRGALATLRASDVRRMPAGYRRACPCCECRTLSDLCPGSWEICPVCFWEDDPVQWEHPAEVAGANRVSLAEARENYAAFGACDRGSLAHVRRPLPSEQPTQEGTADDADD